MALYYILISAFLLSFTLFNSEDNLNKKYYYLTVRDSQVYSILDTIYNEESAIDTLENHVIIFKVDSLGKAHEIRSGVLEIETLNLYISEKMTVY